MEIPIGRWLVILLIEFGLNCIQNVFTLLDYAFYFCTIAFHKPSEWNMNGGYSSNNNNSVRIKLSRIKVFMTELYQLQIFAHFMIGFKLLNGATESRNNEFIPIRNKKEFHFTCWNEWPTTTINKFAPCISSADLFVSICKYHINDPNGKYCNKIKSVNLNRTHTWWLCIHLVIFKSNNNKECDCL